MKKFSNFNILNKLREMGTHQLKNGQSMNLQFTHSHTLTESNFPNILININEKNKIHFLTKIIIIQNVIKNVGKG